MNEAILLLTKNRDILKSSVAEKSKIPMENPTSKFDKLEYIDT